MLEEINESVSVNLLTNNIRRTVAPTALYWRGRRYTITKVGLHHTVHDGRTLIHVFSVTDGVNFFKLEFDTETLGWKLLEIDDNV
ncbi:hypothetical protein HY086_01105 [Candidatus Gottesmanbacteria bacterium]|nr:hypothetical protein [Candidatus Gottesmanbacteria bacterium]